MREEGSCGVCKKGSLEKNKEMDFKKGDIWIGDLV